WVKLLLPMIAPRDSSALFFTFYSSEHPSEDPEVINIPADVYWCLAAFGDSVLLSDGMNMHHYSNVASIDHEKQTVALIDHSPNILSEFIGVVPEIFAAPSGRFAGKTLVQFSRSDFERLFIAAITIDTPEFIEPLKRMIPPKAWTPEIEVA